MKNKMIAFLKRNWKNLFIAFLLIFSWNLFGEKQSLKFALINYQRIPHIGLTNNLTYHNDNSFLGEIRGFVKLNQEKDQPKEARQYYIIQATKQRDHDQNPILTLNEVIALPSSPPTSVGVTKLFKKEDLGNTITLEDENGLRLFYNKDSREVFLEDARLMTSEYDYRDFMWDFLK